MQVFCQHSYCFWFKNNGLAVWYYDTFWFSAVTTCIRAFKQANEAANLLKFDCLIIVYSTSISLIDIEEKSKLSFPSALFFRILLASSEVTIDVADNSQNNAAERAVITFKANKTI